MLLFRPVSSRAGYYVINDVGATGAHAVNDSGVVVGTQYNLAYRWTIDGGKQDLGTLGGGLSEAYDINNAGQVTGVSRDAEYYERAFLWTENDGMQSINDLNICCGYGINEAGHVAGTVHAVDVTSTTAYVWTSMFGLIPVGWLPNGERYSVAHAVNNVGTFGQIVGKAKNSSGNDRAFLWSQGGGGLQDLGTLPGRSASAANDINDSGQVVGDSQYRPFIWTSDDGMQDLGTLGGSVGHAWAINDDGQIVGSSGNPQNFKRATLWEGDQVVDLNDRINPNAGWTELYEALDISDSGRIVGNGTGDNSGGFLLTPALAGDADLDGYVKLADLGTLLTFYNQSVPQDVNGWMKGDFDGDGTVNLADLGSLLTYYNQDIWGGGGGGLDPQALELLAAHGISVPEPSTLALLAAGLAGLFCYTWKKRKGDLHMKRFLILGVYLIFCTVATARAEYIATVSGERTGYNDDLDRIAFTVDGVTGGGKVSTMEGTWTALGVGDQDAAIYLNDSGDWPYYTYVAPPPTGSPAPPLSYCNFRSVNDSAGAVWARTGEGANYSDLLTGSWYTIDNADWVGAGEMLAVMYVSKGSGASFSGRMTAAEYAIGDTTTDYFFSVAPVPEPGALALLVCGLLGLLAYAWRKRA